MRIDHISIEGMLLGVRQASYGGGVLDCKEMNAAHLIVARPKDKTMKNTKCAVKANRGGTRALSTCSGLNRTPIQTRSNRKLALVLGKFKAL